MVPSSTRTSRAKAPRRPRSDGERSRQAILDAAGRLSTVEGIHGLSIARLADEVGMSKSGLFAHFGSKEELQLATIEAATSRYETLVLEPAAAAPRGLERLRLLVDGFLRYVEADTYPGGCFFASVLAEVDTQPGPVRDRLLGFLEDWMGRLREAVRDAQADGDINSGEDAAQLAFEVEAALFLANAQYVLTRTAEPLERARRSIDRLLAQPSTAAGRRRSGRRTG